MHFSHQISLITTSSQREQLKAIGIETTNERMLLKIEETDARWSKWKIILEDPERYGVTYHITGTRFSEEDRLSADYLCLSMDGSATIMPEQDLNSPVETFDISNGCPGKLGNSNADGKLHGCGCGYVQVAPFRLGRMPSVEKIQFFAPMNGDNLLMMNRKIFDDVFSSFDIKFWPVIRHSTGEVIKEIVQLRVDHEVDVNVDGLDYVDCGICGRRKYTPHIVGFYPAPAKASATVMRSVQNFGSARGCARLLMVNQDIYRRIREYKPRNMGIYPCAPVGT